MKSSVGAVQKKTSHSVHKPGPALLIRKTILSKSLVNGKDKQNVGNTGEQCENCHRTFRDLEHLAKHRRGALCKKLVQRVARQNRKLATQRDHGKRKVGVIFLKGW